MNKRHDLSPTYSSSCNFFPIHNLDHSSIKIFPFEVSLVANCTTKIVCLQQICTKISSSHDYDKCSLNLKKKKKKLHLNRHLRYV